MVSSRFTTELRVDDSNSDYGRSEENNLTVNESSTTRANKISANTIIPTSEKFIANNASVSNSPSTPTTPTTSANGNASIGCRSQSGPPSLSINFDDVALTNPSTKIHPVNFIGTSTGSSNLIEKLPSEYGEESYEGLGYGRSDAELVDVGVESPGDGSSSAPSPTPTGLHSNLNPEFLGKIPRPVPVRR